MVTFTFNGTGFSNTTDQNIAGQELVGHQARGAPGVSGIPAIIFGMIFVAAGCGLLYLATGRVPIHNSSHGGPMPLLVFVWIGGIFAAAGLLVVIGGVRGIAKKRAIEAARNGSPSEPWLWDFAWNQYGTDDGGWAGVRKALFFATFFAVFLAGFNYLFMLGDVPFFAKAVIGLFDLFLLGVIASAVYMTVRHLKYGTTGIRFKHFPYKLGDEITLALVRTPKLAPVATLKATLRCIQEKVETRGTGKDRTTLDVCYGLWSGEATADLTHLRDMQDEIPFTFTLPADPAMSSALSEQPPRYWELELKGEAPGVDYGATFLVPVYGRSVGR